MPAAVPVDGIVLAAGVGSRLRPLTDELPKCLVPVGGRPLLMRMLDTLRRTGVRRVVVVAGHRADLVRSAVGDSPSDVVVAHAPAYRSTGTAESLRCGLRRTDPAAALVVLEGDVIAEDEVIGRLLATPAPATAVASGVAGCTGTFARCADGRVAEVSHASWRPAGADTTALAKLVNAHLIGRAGADAGFRSQLDAVLRRDPAAHLEHVLAAWTATGTRLAAVEVGGLRWWEVDDAADLAVARGLFPAEVPAGSAAESPAGSAAHSPAVQRTPAG